MAYFEEIDTFWWFFTKSHTFCNILLKIGSKPYCMVLCTKSGLFRGDRHVLLVFHQMPYFLQHFAKNWVTTLLHGTLQKKVAYFEEIDTFCWFFTKCDTFCNILLKIGSKPYCMVLCTKWLISRRFDTFWWFFTKCHTFCNILLKIGSKPYCMVLCTKSGLVRGDRHVLVVFHQMPYFLQHFAKQLG